jgi:hypothetical protein
VTGADHASLAPPPRTTVALVDVDGMAPLPRSRRQCPPGVSGTAVRHRIRLMMFGDSAVDLALNVNLTSSVVEHG